jgi:hypothetical protein
LDELARYSEAATRFRTAVSRLEQWEREGRLKDRPFYSQGRLPDARERAELAEATPRGMEDLDFALAQAPRTRFRLLSRRAAHHRDREGGEAEMLASIRALCEQNADNADLLCSHACHLALCAGILDQIGPSSEYQQLRTQCLDLALEQLGRSVDLGLNDPTRVEQENDFRAIRDDPRFQELVARLRDRVRGTKH